MVKLFSRLAAEIRELNKNIDAKNSALELGAAVIRSYRDEYNSAAAMIESLNRYIDALEGRDKERVERIDELERERNALREQLSGREP
jgi:chromosome segregation ATPase